MPATQLPKQASMYFAPRCMFCNKNNRRRHTRLGRSWKCQHCGEWNIGPERLRAITQRFTQPPAGTAKHPKATTSGAVAGVPDGNGAAHPPVAVTTTIKGLETPAATPPQAAPAAGRPAPSKPKPKVKAKTAAPPAPPAKRGFLDRLGDAIYG